MKIISFRLMELDISKWPTGVQIAYYISCPVELWLFSHKIQMEHTSELVKLGKLLHENSFKKERKNLIIDNNILIDFAKFKNNIIIHEIKKSSKLYESHKAQLLYYMYYLKKEKAINTKGIINYPLENIKIEITLGKPEEKYIENIIKNTIEIISLKYPPNPIKKKRCKKCSYYEFCWSE